MCSRSAGFCAFTVWDLPCGPVSVTVPRATSNAVIVAVIVIARSIAPPGASPGFGLLRVSRALTPGAPLSAGFTCHAMASVWETTTGSPTRSLSKSRNSSATGSTRRRHRFQREEAALLVHAGYHRTQLTGPRRGRSACRSRSR